MVAIANAPEKNDQLPGIGHLFTVRTIRIAMVSLLALTWVLLTSHCKFEAVSGLEFLHCTDDAHESAEADAGADHCDDKACCSVASAQYYAPRQQEIAPIVVLDILPTEKFEVVEHSLPKEVGRGILTGAPPELPPSWQFLYRTALPIRPPSLAS